MYVNLFIAINSAIELYYLHKLTFCMLIKYADKFVFLVILFSLLLFHSYTYNLLKIADDRKEAFDWVDLEAFDRDCKYPCIYNQVKQLTGRHLTGGKGKCPTFIRQISLQCCRKVSLYRRPRPGAGMLNLKVVLFI